MTGPEQHAAAETSFVAPDSGIQERILVRFLELMKNDASVGESLAAVFANLATVGQLGDRAAIQAAVLQAVIPSNGQTADA